MKINELKTRDKFEWWISNIEKSMENPYAITFNYLFDTGVSRAPSEKQFKKDLNDTCKRIRNRWYTSTVIKRHNIILSMAPFKFETTELVGFHCHGIIDVPKHIKRPDIGIQNCWKYGEAHTKKCDENGFAEYTCKVRTSCHYDNFQDNFHFVEWT